MFARSGHRNVEPCRRAAVLQGQKDASRLSSAGAACMHAEERVLPRDGLGWAELS